MRLSARPLTALLLALLVLAMGPCPGTVVRSFVGGHDDPEVGQRPERCGCGCREKAPVPVPPEFRADRDCPYCSVFGTRPSVLLTDSSPTLDAPAVVAFGSLASNLPTPAAVDLALTARERERAPPQGARLGEVVLQL